MSSLKEAKQICNNQGIKMHLEVPVICPFCGRKCMILDITEEKGECIRCHKEKPIREILRLTEENYLEKHKKSFWNSRCNKGVGY